MRLESVTYANTMYCLELANQLYTTLNVSQGCALLPAHACTYNPRQHAIASMHACMHATCTYTTINVCIIPKDTLDNTCTYCSFSCERHCIQSSRTQHHHVHVPAGAVPSCPLPEPGRAPGTWAASQTHCWAQQTSLYGDTYTTTACAVYSVYACMQTTG